MGRAGGKPPPFWGGPGEWGFPLCSKGINPGGPGAHQRGRPKKPLGRGKAKLGLGVPCRGGKGLARPSGGREGGGRWGPSPFGSLGGPRGKRGGGERGKKGGRGGEMGEILGAPRPGNKKRLFWGDLIWKGGFWGLGAKSRGRGKEPFKNKQEKIFLIGF